MALYLGSDTSKKIYLNGVEYRINSIFTIPIINNIVLLSSDNYMLKDINETYLTAKENE